MQYFKLFHEIFYLQIWIIQSPFFLLFVFGGVL